MIDDAGAEMGAAIQAPRFRQIDVGEDSFLQESVTKICATQARDTEIDIAKVGAPEIGAAEVDGARIGEAKVGAAEKRQHAEPKVVRLKRRKPAPRGLIKIPRRPAKPHTGEIGSKIEAARKAFDALGRKHQLRFIHAACLHLGLDPLKMASPAVFGLAEEEPELAVDQPAQAALATDDAPVDLQSEQQDGAANFDAKDLQHAGGGVSEAADQEPAGANLQKEDASPATDQGSGGATKCAYCGEGFSSIDPPEMKYGRLYHLDTCVKYAKPLASAA